MSSEGHKAFLSQAPCSVRHRLHRLSRLPRAPSTRGPTPFTPQVWLALLPTQVLGPESPQPSPISRLVSPTTPFPPRRQLLQTHRTGLVTLSSRAFGGFLRSQQEDPRTDLPSAPLPCSLSSRRTGHQRGPSSLPSALL